MREKYMQNKLSLEYIFQKQICHVKPKKKCATFTNKKYKFIILSLSKSFTENNI